MIKGDFDLNALSAYLPSVTDPQLTVRIDNYAKPGQLKIDQAAGMVSTLTLQRFSSDSDGVIDVDGSFIDAKGFSGTLILKGLAFRLKANATLIAGFDLVKPNRNLILDSCFLYAESLDGTFLAWQGDPDSRIEIKNSWFVAKTSTFNKANFQIAGGDVILSNNLFNFPGTITGSPISKTFTVRSNTLNRVQIILVGTNYGGSDPTYSFSQNLAAYHGGVNAVGGESYFVLKASSFNDPSSNISNNRIYRGEWKGIDYPNNAKAVGTDSSLSNADGKSATELWDWYTKDAATGMLSGNNQLKRYNVLPTIAHYDTAMGNDSLRVYFKRADFPRMFRLVQGPGPDPLDSAFRMRSPFIGKLSFGPFRIDSLRVNSPANYGKPILLTQTGSNAFAGQAGLYLAGSPATVFINNLLAARGFVLVDSGNTPRGDAVEPANTQGEPFDHLRFGRVTVSGQTKILGDVKPDLADSLRYLGRIFGFTTTASVRDTLIFATAPSQDSIIWSRPQDAALYWLWKGEGKVIRDGVIPASYGSVWGESLIQGSVPYSDTLGTFKAFLVEKLSMPAGFPYRKVLPEAVLHSYSPTGYQIYPEIAPPDTLHYGSPTSGYIFRWTGRVDRDSLFLILPKPASPDAQVFVRVPTKTEDEPVSPPPTLDSGGNYRIRLAVADSGKTFFAGVKYNIIANAPRFDGIVDGVRVNGLASSISGRLSFRDLPANEAQGMGNGRDTVFRNTRYISGKTIDAQRLISTGPFTLTFSLPAGAMADTAFEVWALSNGSWEKIPGPYQSSGDSLSVPVASLNTTHLVAVKRFQAPETYARPTLAPGRDTLIFNLGGIDPSASPIHAYCLDVRAISLNGEVRNLGCHEKAPGDTVRMPTDPGWAYTYRVVYILGNERDTVAREFQYPPQFAWDSKKALEANPRRDLSQGTWRLVSVPTGRIKLNRLLGGKPRVKEAGDSGKTILTLTVAVGISNPGGVAKFDTLTRFGNEGDNRKDLDTVHLDRFRALMIASSHPDTLSLDAAEGGVLKSPRPETLAVVKGWNFVGNPYPISLRKECVRSEKRYKVRLRSLEKKSLEYGWDTLTTMLPPFTGFAYFSPEADRLIYDPAVPVPAPSAKKTSDAESWIGVSLTSGFGRADMALVRGKGEYPVGILPTPQARLELRVGGNGGYWIKPVEDPMRIDEPVEIRSAKAGTAGFTVGAEGSGPEFILIDEATGQAYDRVSARALPLRAGTHSYRLIAGDPGYVAERSRSFAASAPAAIGLSQNFPNPARGLTRIVLEWPVTRDRDRKAWLEVLDTRGRRIAFRNLDGMRVGRQMIDLDAAAWKPGVYVYRLVVRADGKVSRLQRKMLVAP